MKSVFSLFEKYQDCEAAVDDLLEADFAQDEFNLIVKAEVARTHLDVDLDVVDVKATDQVGQESRGLDVLLGVEQPIDVPRLGRVYAAGEIATIMAKTVESPRTGTVADTLEEFGVPSSMTTPYIEAIANDWLLFWVRTSDERAALAGEILRRHNGKKMASHG